MSYYVYIKCNKCMYMQLLYYSITNYIQLHYNIMHVA